jgi:O-antigen/teichoic acid export membrane protein
MNRTNRFITGVALNYGYQAVVMVVGLWLTPFLLHHLGQRNYGIWLVGLQALSYIALLDIGVVGLLPREVAYVSGRIHSGADLQEMRTLLEENAMVILCQTPIVFLIMGVAWYILRAHTAGLASVLLIIMLTYGIQFPIRLFYAALEGLQDFGYIGYLQMAGWSLGVIVNVALVLKGFGLYGLALGWAATQATISLGSVWRMYTRHSHMCPRRVRWLGIPRLVKYLKSGFWVSMSQITQMLVKSSDVVMLASLRGPAAVVPYSCSSKLQSVLANQPQVILQAAQPGLTQLRATGDRKHTGTVIGTLAQAMLTVSGGVAIIILAVNKGFVQKWVGPDQYLGFWFTLAITIGMLLRHWNGTTIYSLFCFEKERFISIIGLIESLSFVAFSYVLVRLMGTIGIPIASIASLSVASLPWTLRALRRVTRNTLREQLAPLREWFVPFLGAAALAGLAVRFYTPGSYFACAYVVTIASVVYLLLELRVIRRSLWGEKLQNLVLSLTGKLRDALRLPVATPTDESA